MVAPQRSPALPEVPTAAEAGLKDFEVTTWYGVLAPAGTPRPIVTRLNAELGKIMHAADVKERLAGMATDPLTSTPEEFARFPALEAVVRDDGSNLLICGILRWDRFGRLVLASE